MPYDLTIKTSSETIQKRIEDLKEFKEAIKDYERAYTEINLRRVKEKKKGEVK